MRLGFLLTVSLLGMALLVAVLGILLEGTSDAIGGELDELRRSSIEEVLGADGMDQALKAATAAAYRLLAERYRERAEISHESGNEWGALTPLDLDSVDEQLEEFEDALAQTGRAVAAGAELAQRRGDRPSADAVAQQRRFGEIRSQFAVHRGMLERLVHLIRYHPNEHVREYLQDELEPHYEETMAPLLREFAGAARADLDGATRAVERLVARATTRNRWLTGLALALALAASLPLSRAISRPLGRLHDAALRIGAGDLEHRVEVRADNEIGALAAAFNQMAENLRASTVSRTFLDNILQSMREIVMVVDSTGTIQTANQVAVEQLGDGEASLRGRNVGEIVAGGADGLESGAGECDLRRVDGSTFPASFSRSELRGPGGSREGFVLVARDITERRESEARLRRSLHEKEILLKEVHHRVKNNLQIVSSLLRLQEGDMEGPNRDLRESQNRIRSMALIHEHLYQSPDLANIDFSAYVEELVKNLLASYGERGERVRAEVTVLTCPLSLDTAIPCGMIVNELVANALEHAFDAGGGTLWISYGPRNGHHELRVADDGRGLPADFDLTGGHSLGLRLVSALTTQLGGELAYASSPRRTEFTMRFRPPEGQTT
ncbi:MAG: HAMP domain-containing protein [Acidobacteriota bacterium]|nr:HAMP domain-containing protein [Acidobacteriota bacterium]